MIASITVTLREIVQSGLGTRVDREAGVIRGVKILGLESLNGRRYLPEAVRRAVSLYEGRVVNANHDRLEGGGDRSIDDRLGWLSSVSESNGLMGDLHVLKSDPRAEKIFEAAERNPTLFGLSHNIEARTSRKDNSVIVEEIIRVRSVDVVSDPATTKSLFESEESAMDGVSPADAGAAGAGDMTLQMFLDKATEVFNAEGDPAAKAKQIGQLAKTLLKVQGDLDAALNPGEKPEEKPEEGDTAESLKRKIDQLERRDAVRTLLEAEGVKAEPPLIEALCLLESDAKRKALLATYPKQAPTGRSAPPRPMAEAVKDMPKDAKAFAESVT